MPDHEAAGVRFRCPDQSFKGIRPEAAAAAFAFGSDVALVLEKSGEIQDASFAEGIFPSAYGDGLVGARLHDLVSADSVGKVEAALADAANRGASSWRQLNHPIAGRPDRPIRYRFAKLENSKRFLAVGRDMEADSILQRRLIDAQQQMEREYSRLRDAESRYRLLFSQSSEAIIVADAQTQRLVEINTSAQRLFRVDASQAIGKPLSRLFEGNSAAQIKTLFSQLRAMGSVEIKDLKSANSHLSLSARATSIHQCRERHALVRFFATDASDLRHHNVRQNRFIEAIDAAPEGFVIVDREGVIALASEAMTDMTQVLTINALIGQKISRWLGRAGAEWGDLRQLLDKDGSVKFFTTVMTGELGTSASVEVSAVLVPHTSPVSIGLVIRDVEARINSSGVNRPILPSSTDQVRDLVGRVSLKELVRETTDVVERMCIETALDLAGDNRASAAEMLGVSRQSLYVKLRRYGFDVDDGDEAE